MASSFCSKPCRISSSKIVLAVQMIEHQINKRQIIGYLYTFHSIRSSFCDGCDDCDGRLFDTAPAVILIVTTVTNRHTAFRAKLIKLPLRVRFTRYIQCCTRSASSPCLDIEPARSQNVRLYILAKQCYKLCCAAVPYGGISGNHGCEFAQQRVGRFLPKLSFRMIELPCQLLGIPRQMELFDPADLCRRFQGWRSSRCAFPFCRKMPPIRTAKQSCCAGDHFKFVSSLLLCVCDAPKSRHTTIFVSKLFHPAHDVIIVGIAVSIGADLADFLQGVDDNEPGIGMLPDEPFKLLIKSCAELLLHILQNGGYPFPLRRTYGTYAPCNL